MNREQAEAHAVNNLLENLRLRPEISTADVFEVDPWGVVHVVARVILPITNMEAEITIL